MSVLRNIMITIGLFLAVLNGIYGQLISHNFESVDSLQQLDKRNVVVFLHTDWCKYCKSMEKTTLANGEVIDKLNQETYFVTFEAESKQDVHFNHAKFSYIPRGRNTGTHELAEALGTIDGKLNFPVICILNSEYEIVFQFSGFLTSDALLKILASF